ncbi:hypothetical protein [Ideonella margarita]|uniref:Holliday junction resolvase n=1 Tax=Ideonella margarita TaxID=2984191 RepID=A0ABU9C3J9_9BURK
MSTQAEKYHQAMAGEYFVAAQLQRLGVAASVMYGNAKSADVVAFIESSTRAVVIEVKTSRSGRWPVGRSTPTKSRKPLVFVDLPNDIVAAPSFFVVTQEELHNLLIPLEQEYRVKYRAKHNEEYGEKPGVVAATRTVLAGYADEWATILKQVAAEPTAQAEHHE